MLADIRRRAESLLRQGADRCTPAQWDDALRDALAQYNRHRPRMLVEDVTLVSTQALPLPSAWVAGFSDVLALEKLPETIPPNLIAPTGYYSVMTPGGEAYRLIDAFDLGTVLRVTFSAPHICTDAMDTTNPNDWEAIACWAAASLCDGLAAEAADNTAPTINADRADTSNPAREWAKRATQYRARFADLLGIQGLQSGGAGGSGSAPLTPAAGTTAAWEMDSSNRLGWQTHWRRFR